MKLCLDASQSFHNLALFSVGMYFRANVTYIFFHGAPGFYPF